MIEYKKIKYQNILPIKYGVKTPQLTLFNFASNCFYSKKYRIPEFSLASKLNILDQISVSEPEHSKILANLLNPEGTHGLNNLFLNLFLYCFVPEIIFNENENWIVTAEKERYDIRIKNINNSKIIIIENKSNNAEDKPNQLYRYWFNGIYMTQLSRKLNGLECFSKIIYLSPSDYKQPDRQSLSRPNYFNDDLPMEVPRELINISFFNDQIVKWLDLCIKHVDINTNIYYYLSQYRDFWS